MLSLDLLDNPSPDRHYLYSFKLNLSNVFTISLLSFSRLSNAIKIHSKSFILE